MNLDLLVLALADGFSYAGLLFLVALGLTLIFGVAQILNVAHVYQRETDWHLRVPPGWA